MPNFKVNGTSLSGADLKFDDTFPSAPSGELAVRWYTDTSLTGGGSITVDHISATVRLEDIDHTYLNATSLGWEVSGHVSGETTAGVAAFNDSGEAVFKTVQGLAEQMDHADLDGKSWPASGHTAGDTSPGVAAFGTGGVAEKLSFTELAEKLSHADLDDLGWTAGGTTTGATTEGRIAAFDPAGDATLFTPGELRAFAVEGTGWEALALTCPSSTAGRIAAFDPAGGPTLFEPSDLAAFVTGSAIEEAVDTAIEAALDDDLMAPGSIVAAVRTEMESLPLSAAGQAIRDYILGALQRPKFPKFEAVEWMEVAQGSVSSQSLIANDPIFMMHYQEEEECEYSHISITNSSAITAGSKNLQFALYIDTDDDGYPETVIWYSSAIAMGGVAGNTKTSFAFASGTWVQPAAGDFEAANHNLRCKRGDTVWRCRDNDFNMSTKVINASCVRSIGRSADGNSQAYNALKFTGTPVAISTNITAAPGATGGLVPSGTQVPIMPLTRA